MQQISPLLQTRIEQWQSTKQKAISADLSNKPDTVELSSKAPVNKKLIAKIALSIAAIAAVIAAVASSIIKEKTPVQIKNIQTSAKEAVKQAQDLANEVQEKAEKLKNEVVEFFDNISKNGENQVAKITDKDGTITIEQMIKGGTVLRRSCFRGKVLSSIEEIKKSGNADLYEFSENGLFSRFRKGYIEHKDKTYCIEEILGFKNEKLHNYGKGIRVFTDGDKAVESVHFEDCKPIIYYRGAKLKNVKDGLISEVLYFKKGKPYDYQVKQKIAEGVEEESFLTRNKYGKWVEN